MFRVALLFLRNSFGIMMVAYIDDLLIQAKDAAMCAIHSKITLLVLHCLRYGVNCLMSSLMPSHTVDHLGFT